MGPVEADNINSRLEHQQGKIAKQQGKKKISAYRAAKADENCYKMLGEEQKMRDRHHGKLTRRDKNRLNRRMNRNAGNFN